METAFPTVSFLRLVINVELFLHSNLISTEKYIVIKRIIEKS